MTDITLFASKTGSNIVTGLTATAAEYDGQLIQGAVVFGLIKYTFSGAPDLSLVLQGHSLNVTGFTNANNNGSGMYIQSFSNVDKTITVKMVERTNNSEDETGATASATVTTAGAEIKELSVAKNAQGFVTGEKVSAGHLNWIQQQTIAQAGDINDILAAIDVDDLTDNGYLVGRRLTAGSNVTLSDNGDGTERIDVGLFGKSTAANTGITQSLGGTEHVCKATVDNTNVSAGRVRVYADDAIVATVAATEKNYYMFDADTDVEIRAENILNNINAATYSGLSLSSVFSNHGIFMRADEARFFVVDLNDFVRTYDVGTPGNISTASEDLTKSLNVGGGRGIFFKPDGLQMYITESNQIRQYTLSTAWDPSTGTLTTTYSASFTDGQGLFISPDGLHCFVVEDATTNRVYQLDFGTAWDASTLSSVSNSSAINTQTAGQAWDIMLNSDGTKMYILGNATDQIFQYSLSTAYTLGTPTYDSISLNVTGQDTDMRGIHMVDDLRFYTSGDQNNRAYQYTIGTAYAGTSRYQLEYGVAS